MGVSSDNLIKKMQNALQAEKTISFCFLRLANLIHNGKVKDKFVFYSQEAKNNYCLFKERLAAFGENEAVFDDKCKFCKINLESFSLIGAVNLGIEIANAAINFYKELLEICKTPEDKELFTNLIREKNKQMDSLKKEKRFILDKETNPNLMDSYCMPEVISKLWH